ncbi:MAG: helix-hairpin-helix domain-containing protein [Longimonas sp.]
MRSLSRFLSLLLLSGVVLSVLRFHSVERASAAPASRGGALPLRSDTTDAWAHLLPYLDDEPHPDVLTRWQTWMDDPLDLNTASADRLQQLPGVSLRQALQIVSYRGTHGPFADVAALQQVPTLSTRTYRMVAPFVQVRPDAEEASTSAREAAPWWRHDWHMQGLLRAGRRIERARGYTGRTDVPYLGSPYRSVLRLRAWNAHLDMGLTTDKRPGEPLQWDPTTRQYGADHLVGYLRLRDRGRLRQLVVGSYQAAFGHGLALWTGARFASAYGTPQTLLRHGSGVRAYRGTNPHSYFRGVGATVRITPQVDATAFVSHRNRDATLDTLQHASDIVARSLRSTSLRRTTTERQYRRVLPTTHVGGQVQWQAAGLRVGLLGLYARFGHPLVPSLRPDTRHDFAGQWTTHWSLAAHYTLSENLTLVGEGALTGPEGRAAVLGAHADIGRAATLVVRGYAMHRRYDALDMGSLPGSGGAGSQGAETRLALTVHPHWTLYGALQQTYTRNPQFRTTRPEVATRASAAVHYDPHTQLHLRLQGQWRTRDHRQSTTYPYGPTVPVHSMRTQHNVRTHLRYAFTETLRFDTRAAWTYVQQPDGSETGTLLWVETGYAPLARLSTNMRWTLFGTDSFESRLFAYEPDVRYGFSVPALFEHGQRAHVLVRLDLTSAVHLEAKYSVTAYTNRDVIGQGRDQIDSSRVRNWRLQLRWTL